MRSVPLRRLPRALLLLVALALQIGCDQATKDLARTHLEGTAPRSFFGGLFKLVYAENPGAFLGLGGSWAPEVRFWLLTVIVGFGLGAALLWLGTRRKVTVMGLAAGALLVAGGIGNFIDRVMHSGRVIDFMQIGIGPVKTGIFNVADVQIVLGALAMWWVAKEDAREEPGEGAPPAAPTDAVPA